VRRRDRRGASRIEVALAVVVAACLVRCAGPAPPVPDPDLTAMEPRVASVLREARQAVVERGSAQTWGALATSYDAHGLLDQAEVCYRQAKRLDPGAFEWTYLYAIVRELRGAEADEVGELFGAAAAARPDYAPIFVRLGAALALRGEHEHAREAFARATVLAPQNAVAHRGLGQVLLALGDASGAIGPLERAAELEPRDLAARSALVRAYVRVGREADAHEAAERARGLGPINSFDDPVHAERVFLRSVSSSRAFTRAQAALALGRLDQALADLEIVVAARPDDASAHYWKGMVHRRLGQVPPALEHLNRAVHLEPTLVQAQLELGALCVQLGRHAEAIEHLERAAALRPLDADGLYGLGLAYEGAGRAVDASRTYEAAVALDPAHPAGAKLRRP
jgi:tetratricopeptide (TPR) repeat protein